LMRSLRKTGRQAAHLRRPLIQLRSGRVLSLEIHLTARRLWILVAGSGVF
jgi:hypothetical protein